jgi:hypothetical protein
MYKKIMAQRIIPLVIPTIRGNADAKETTRKKEDYSYFNI